MPDLSSELDAMFTLCEVPHASCITDHAPCIMVQGLELLLPPFQTLSLITMVDHFPGVSDRELARALSYEDQSDNSDYDEEGPIVGIGRLEFDTRRRPEPSKKDIGVIATFLRNGDKAGAINAMKAAGEKVEKEEAERSEPMKQDEDVEEAGETDSLLGRRRRDSKYGEHGESD